MKKLILFVIIVLLIISPFLYWKYKDETVLNIAVVDKTVPKTDYREHSGLFWILENQKISKADGSLYDITQDYFGYDPITQEENKAYDTEGIVDLIYIADTYGVYTDDLEDVSEGERSEKIYGGMTLNEWETIMNSKSEHTTLIAEFNSFGTPTAESVRSRMEEDLGVSWTGWTGRYFQDLNSDEVPPWLIGNYENQYKKKWDFNGSGLAFVHSTDKVIVLDEKDSKDYVTLNLTSKGTKELKTVKSSNCVYWFEIVEPKTGSEVLAEYTINISSEGEKQLIEAGIPTVFPAVVHNSSEKTYYFAGDFSDYVPYKFSKIEKVDVLLKYISHGDSEFYWSTYVPLMKEIIEKVKE